MKKFMKAIAFATVMCLVLSTVAFAAAEITDYTTKAITVTVEGVQKGEQVAIIITKNGADFTKENILFVDQKAAGASTAVFNTTITEADVETVDVYAGFASNSASAAVLVAADVELTTEEVVEITVTLKDVQIVNDITEVTENDVVISSAEPDTKAALVYFKINVANAEAGDIAGMAWAFVVQNDETEVEATKYAEADSTIVAALGSVLTGDVEIAAALDSTGYTVTDAKVLLSVKGEEVELAE